MRTAGRRSRLSLLSASRRDEGTKPLPGAGTPSSLPDRVGPEIGFVPSFRDLPASDTPDREAVFSALRKILNSDEFRSVEQLRSFLHYIVTEAMTEGAQQIKGYTIAVEALGRDTSFNPVTDPIVRVEAARLRRRLETYYTGNGLHDPIRIEIPRGGYTPSFHHASPHRSTPVADVKDDPALDVPGSSDPDSGEVASLAPTDTPAIMAPPQKTKAVSPAAAARGYMWWTLAFGAGALCFVLGYAAGSA